MRSSPLVALALLALACSPALADERSPDEASLELGLTASASAEERPAAAWLVRRDVALEAVKVARALRALAASQLLPASTMDVAALDAALAAASTTAAAEGPNPLAFTSPDAPVVGVFPFYVQLPNVRANLWVLRRALRSPVDQAASHLARYRSEGGLTEGEALGELLVELRDFKAVDAVRPSRGQLSQALARLGSVAARLDAEAESFIRSLTGTYRLDDRALDRQTVRARDARVMAWAVAERLRTRSLMARAAGNEALSAALRTASGQLWTAAYDSKVDPSSRAGVTAAMGAPSDVLTASLLDELFSASRSATWRGELLRARAASMALQPETRTEGPALVALAERVAAELSRAALEGASLEPLYDRVAALGEDVELRFIAELTSLPKSYHASPDLFAAPAAR